MSLSLSVVIVAFNEEGSLRETVGETHDFLKASPLIGDYEVVLVDDGSTDSTPSQAKAMASEEKSIKYIRHPERMGMGAALKTGYKHASMEFITFLPADGQIKPREIGKLLPFLQKADMVLTIYENAQPSLLRSILSKGLRSIIWLFFGSSVKLEGIYAFKREILSAIPPLRSTSFFLNFELPIMAKKRGFKIVSTTIERHERLAGQSKVVNVKTMRRVLRDLLKVRFSSG